MTYDSSGFRAPDVMIGTYELDLGDGIAATGRKVIHTYSNVGHLDQPTLIVTGNQGGKAFLDPPIATSGVTTANAVTHTEELGRHAAHALYVAGRPERADHRGAVLIRRSVAAAVLVLGAVGCGAQRQDNTLRPDDITSSPPPPHPPSGPDRPPPRPPRGPKPQ